MHIENGKSKNRKIKDDKKTRTSKSNQYLSSK
jgi:hypothetical protein